MKPNLALARTDEPSDEELMGRFCNGDSAAFETLYLRHAAPLRGYLARILGSVHAAEDQLQVTFVSVVRGRDRFLAGSRVKPWLYAIATNAARDLLRRRGTEALSDDPPEAVAAAVEPQVTDYGLERRVRAALDQLPDSQREAILLHRWEGLSFAEVAQALGISESAAKVRAHRGYERLRELLSDLAPEAPALAPAKERT